MQYFLDYDTNEGGKGFEMLGGGEAAKNGCDRNTNAAKLGCEREKRTRGGGRKGTRTRTDEDGCDRNTNAAKLGCEREKRTRGGGRRGTEGDGRGRKGTAATGNTGGEGKDGGGILKEDEKV